MARMQGTQVQLRNYRDEHLRFAERDAEALIRTRTEFRNAYRTMLRCEWDAAFYAKDHPLRSTSIGANVPRLQRTMDRYAGGIKRLEAEVLDSLAIARKADARVVKVERKQWVEPGWWTLVRLCWLGWRNGRAAA